MDLDTLRAAKGPRPSVAEHNWGVLATRFWRWHTAWHHAEQTRVLTSRTLQEVAEFENHFLALQEEGMDLTLDTHALMTWLSRNHQVWGTAVARSQATTAALVNLERAHQLQVQEPPTRPPSNLPPP